MSLSRRLLAANAAAGSRHATSLLVSRSYATSPYPFTKPDDPVNKASRKQAQANTHTPYPFTKLSEPAQVPPPSAVRDRPGPVVDNSDMISVETRDDIEESPNQPDYNAPTDYRTSVYSPIPQRLMDGSEPTEVTPAAVISGAPPELQARTVRIFKPAKPATQSGDWHHHQWQMDWDILSKGHRWENPLMGWQSSGDFMQATHLNFKSKEDAIRFAQKQGYEYFVQEPNERRFRVKQYAAQFEHQAKPLKLIRTK